MKKIALLAPALLLSSCMHSVDNPYDALPKSELSKISATQLCETINNNTYKRSAAVETEVSRRGYKSCSVSELFCREEMNLKPETDSYVSCIMQRDQFELNKKQVEQERDYQQKMLQEQRAIQAKLLKLSEKK